MRLDMLITIILQMTDPITVPLLILAIVALGLFFLFGAGYYILTNTPDEILKMGKNEYYDMYLAYREQEASE